MSVPTRPTTTAATLRPVAWGPLLAIAGSLVTVAISLGSRYGYHRDELYFLACSRRLAWGYVDQPPFTPFVARVATEVFGTSLTGLRILPAIAAGITVLVVALTARELGGGRYAQLLAAGAAALVPVFHTPAITLSTAVFDQLVWALCLLAVTRMLRTGDDRWWLAVGACAGVGLLNKHAVVFLGLALVIGFLLGHRRDLLLRPTAAAGAVLAGAIWAPNLWWQARHGWPVLEMSSSLQAENGGLANAVLFVPAQLVLTGVATAVIWAPGLWWLLRGGRRRFEPLGLAAVALALLLPLVGGKPYYFGAMYVVLFAAGGVYLETLRLQWRRRAVWAAIVAGLVTLPASLPVVPPSHLGPILSLNGEFGEMYGWPELADQVAAVYAALPPAEQETTVVLTANYGEHGAVERFGAPRGLPAAYSGHNNIWWWGHPPEDTTTVVTVGIPITTLRSWFRTVEPMAVVENPAGLDNEEAGYPIAIARDPWLPWPALWPEVRTYN